LLTLHDLRTDEQPGTLYHLYLDLPVHRDSGSERSASRCDVEFLQRAGTRVITSDPLDASASYDITDLVRTLKAAGALTAETSITIIPSRRPVTGSSPMIGANSHRRSNNHQRTPVGKMAAFSDLGRVY
jgi:hypothetical protein